MVLRTPRMSPLPGVSSLAFWQGSDKGLGITPAYEGNGFEKHSVGLCAVPSYLDRNIAGLCAERSSSWAEILLGTADADHYGNGGDGVFDSIRQWSFRDESLDRPSTIPSAGNQRCL